MLRNVFAKSLRDQRRKGVGWTVGLCLFAFMIAGVYPSYSTTAKELERFMERAPAAMRALFGGTDLDTAAGYLHTEVFSFMAPMFLILFAVALGAKAIAGEERRGTLDLLMSTPVSRRRVATEKFLAMIVATCVIGAVLWGALAIGGAMASMDIGAARLGETVLSCVLLALVFGSLAFAVAAGTGSTAIPVGVAATVAVTTFLTDGLAPVVSGLRTYQWLSPFHYFFDAEPLKHGMNPSHAAILVGLSAVFFLASLAGFERRDLGT